jgi:deoxycytidine triphosphate deaminase
VDPILNDPAPELQGVLLSDQIHFYVERVGLIEGWEPSSLKPASYGLRLGGRYYSNGEFGDLRPGQKLTIPRNSIVYVSMLEVINMPMYMIGRFNLKIDLIYQGIILGTGPQVDPGFRGRLSCPLHNISNNDVELEYGQRFATIDFVKTTPFTPSADTALSAEELYRQHGEHLTSRGGRPLVLFNREKLERRTLDNYLPSGRTFKSSLADIQDRLSYVQRFNVAIMIGAAAILVSFMIGGATIAWNQFQYYRELRDKLDEQLTRDAKWVEDRVRLVDMQSALEARLKRLEGQVAKPGTTSEPQSRGGKQ